MKLKEMVHKKEQLTGGHRMCAGCGAPIAIRQTLMGVPDDVELVVVNPTGCLEVSTTIYPYSAWKTSFMHNAFENAASTLSGIETAYRSLKKQGKVDADYRFVAFAGDGGTYDIGFQALSGALERGHRMVYVCYNNEAYMNTGIQRSGATTFGAWTTTSPVGEESIGKAQFRKDLTAIVAAHGIPYTAQASISNWRDLANKAAKAFTTDGPAFLNILAPCHRGWRFPMEETVDVARMAVQSKVWPLYEVEYGEWKLNYKPKKEVPLEDYLKTQGRFAHLVKKEENQKYVETLQQFINEEWQRLLKKCGEEE